MPAPIVGGLIVFLENNLDAYVFDGEVPRQDPAGAPTNPESTTGPPTNWPVIRLYMDDSGFGRQPTFVDAYIDEGDVLVRVYSTSRGTTEQLLGEIEALMLNSSNWGQQNQTAIPLGGPPANPYYVISILLTRWTSVQEANERLAGSQYSYRGDLYFQVRIHGAAKTYN